VPGDLADLCFEFHYGCDLAEGNVLGHLQAALGRLAPRMSATLEVHGYERDRTRRPVNIAVLDALRAAVVAKGTEQGQSFQTSLGDGGGSGAVRRFGHVLLRGRGPGSSRIFLSVEFDSMVPARPIGRTWVWSNSIGGRLSARRVEGIDRQAWVCQLAEQLTTTTTILWGAAYLHPEFASSNLDTSQGMRAIGRDVRTALPGIYWLNIFGPPYVDLIGEQRLLDGTAKAATRSGDHITIRPYRDAEDWQSNEPARHQLKVALGAEYFFDRNDPFRRYRAPDFGLAELPANPPHPV
jgi:hypothetical protein